MFSLRHSILVLGSLMGLAWGMCAGVLDATDHELARIAELYDEFERLYRQ